MDFIDHRSTAKFIFKTSATDEKARIDDSGNILTGKTSSNFSTAGAEVRNLGNIWATRDGGVPLALNRLSSEGTIAQFYKDGSSLGVIASVSSDFVIYSTISGHTGLRFGDGWIGSTNNAGTLQNGTVSLGTTAYKFADLHLSGNANIGGNATITGDLTVNGTTTTLNTATLDVEDKNITLNYGAGDTSSTADGAGITIQDAVDASNNATILWDATNDEFDFSHAINVPSLTTTGNVSFGDNDKAIFGAGSDVSIYSDGTNGLITSTANFTLDVAGDITLDADGADIKLLNGGTHWGSLYTNSTPNNLYLQNMVSDGDIYLSGFDGGSNISALILDMSAAGAATFNAGASFGGTVTTDGLEVEAAAPVLEISSTTLSSLASINFTSGGSDIDSKITHQGNTGVMTIDSGRNATWGGKIDFVTDTDTRMRISNNGDISFYDSAGSSQSLFWDASTKFLGLGSTAPAAKLDIVDTASDVQMRVYKFDGTKNTRVTVTADDSGAKIHYRDADNAGALRFNNNLGEVMRITANTTQVGIGTSSPFSNQILNTSWSAGAPYGTVLAVTGNNTNDANWGHLLITDSTKTTGSGGTLRFGTGSTSSNIDPFSGIDGYTEGSNYGGLKFLTRPSGGTATERMRIDANGNVGIGTSSIDGTLHLDGGTSSDLIIEKDATGSAAVRFHNAGSQLSYISLTSTEDMTYYGASGVDQIFYAGGYERMRIDSSGNVGIGVSPTFSAGGSRRLLQLTNGASGGQLAMGNNANESENPRIFSDADNLGFATATTGGGVMQFYTGGSEHMRIDSSGTVYIGSTSDSGTNYHRLSDDGFVRHKRSGAVVAVFDRDSTDGDIILIRKNGTAVGSISSTDNSGIIIGSNDVGLRFRQQSAGAAVFPREPDGSALDATLDLGISNSRFKDLYLSGTANVGGVAVIGTDATDVASIGTSGQRVYIKPNGTEIIYNASGNSAGQHVWQTGNAERVRIDSSGRVGIGASSPSDKLTLDSGQMRLSDNYGIRWGSASTAIYGSGGAGTLQMYTNSTERMRIDSSGNVKIGDSTTDITSKLTVSGNASADVATFMYDGSAGTYLDIDCNAAGGSVNLKADARTGAYPPLLFTTGGSERMRIDASGNVGIGGTPNSYSGQTALTINSTGVARLDLDIGNTNQGYLLAENGYIGLYAESGKYVSMGVVGSGEAMRIDSSGRVGIGTSSPNYKLETKDGDIAVVKLEAAAGGNAVNGIRFRVNNSANTAESATLGMVNAETVNSWGGVLTFSTKPANGTPNESVTERMRIDSSGRVGIGTSSPRYDFSVSGNNATAMGIALDNASGSGTADIAILGASYGSHQAGAGEVWFYSPDNINIGGATGNTNNIKFLANNKINMFIEGSSGNVGIGTSSPTSVQGFAKVLKLEDSSNASIVVSGGLHEAEYAVSSSGGWFGTSTNIPQRFITNNTEQMRLDASGNLLVGKTATAFGTAGVAVFGGGEIDITNTNEAPLFLNRLSSDGAIAQFYKDGTAVGSIGTSSSSLYIGKSSGSGLMFQGGNTIPVTGSSAADATYNLGASGVRFKDLYLSGKATANSMGLGTISPAHALDIERATGSVGIGLQARDNSSSAYINFGDNTDDDVGQIKYVHSSNALQFRVNASERARIDASGNLLLGKTSADNTTQGIRMLGSSGFMSVVRSSNTLAVFNRIDSDGTLINFRTNGTTRGSISISGSTTSYNTTSDQRAKENIVDAPSASDDIDAIKVRSFDFKADGSHQKYGMVAQELSTVAPEAVSVPDDAEEMQSVDYSKLVPMMLKEIQTLRARVAQLEGEN